MTNILRGEIRAKKILGIKTRKEAVQAAAEIVFAMCPNEVPITRLGEQFKDALIQLCEQDKRS